MPAPLDVPVPTQIADGPAVAAALDTIAATEAAGANMTTGQYQALDTAVDAVLAAHRDLGDHPVFDGLTLDLGDWSDRGLGTWLVIKHLLVAHRGRIPAPAGTHGPWPGTRCVYCGSNNLDVDLYTVDPTACPPVWACGTDHPDRRVVDHDDWRWFAHCQLIPEHPGDHTYDLLTWPGPIDADAEYPAIPHGPPTRERHTWPR